MNICKTRCFMKRFAIDGQAEKKVLAQIYIHGVSMQEMADSLGESRQNISRIHKRALEKIRELLNSKAEGNDNSESARRKEIEKLLENFTPMIKSKLNNTSYQEREDLEQELKMKICEKAEMLLCQEVPGFWEFITELLKVL